MTQDGTQWRPDFAGTSRIFAPLAAAARGFMAHPAWPTLADFDALAARLALVTASGLPLRFVAAPPKPRRGRRRPAAGLPYNERIHRLGEVPTRVGSWHDFFNVLAWATFPRAKAALNERQVATTAGTGRCHEQNRLAMLDEGGVVVLDGEYLVLGHALCEAVMLGQHDVHGMACPLPADVAGAGGASLAARVALADAALAQDIAAAAFAAPARFGTVPLRTLL